MSNLGRREEALRATQEAVEAYRGLAEQRPDAFLPDLAMSLGAIGSIHVSTGSEASAVEAFAEGLRLILPLAEQLPGAFEQLAVALARDLWTAANDGKIPIPADLLPLFTEPDQLRV